MTESMTSKSRFSVKNLVIGCSVLLLVSAVVALLAVVLYVRSLIVTIEPDEVAVLISPYEPTGYSETALTPGRYMLRPTETVERFQISTEVFASSSSDCACGSNSVILRTKDGVDITIDYQVTYVIDTNQIVNLYRTWHHDYQVQFVSPHSKQVVKQVASQYNSTEIAVSNRAEIEQAIFSHLESDFSEAYLIVLEFKIDDVRINS